MKKKIFPLFIAGWVTWQMCGCAGQPTEKSLGIHWLTDLPTAEMQARTQGKIIFVDFEGSDWCTGCIEMQREVFPTKQFADYARTNLVLMQVDFPEGKDLPPELKKANDKLSRDYKVDGVPTMLVLDADGHELGRLSYEPGETAAQLVEQLQKFKPHS